MPLPQRISPDGGQKQDGRLMPGVRNVKTITFAPQSDYRHGTEHGKKSPTHFGLDINTKEGPLWMPVNVGIIDISGLMDKGAVAGVGGGIEALLERLQVFRADGQVNIRRGILENILVVAQHAIR